MSEMHPPRESIDRLGSLLHEPIWIESNEQKEAARALEMLHVQLISAVIDPYSWSWVMVALHHAVLSFVVAALQSAGPTTQLEPEEPAPGLRVQFGDPKRYAETRADYLPELYQELKRTIGFAPGEEVDRDIAHLSEFRNVFSQRIPSTWELRVNDLPRVTRNCLKVVEFLGWNPGHMTWRRENLTDLARVKFLASMKVLEALQAQYRS